MESFSFFRDTGAAPAGVAVLWAGVVGCVVDCAPAEIAIARGKAKTKIDLLTFIDGILKRKNRLIFDQIWPTFKQIFEYIFKTNNILYEASSHCLACIFPVRRFGS